MRVLEAVEKYVTLRRSLGAICLTEERGLLAFARFVGDLSIEEVTPEQCERFCYGRLPLTTTSCGKHQRLKRLFRFLVGRGHVSRSPAEGPTRRVVSTFQPYIYSHVELKGLLDGTRTLNYDRRHFDGVTLRTLLLFLYATGLRVGEAVALRVCDVDFRRQILTVLNAKFFKSRLVPFGGEITNALKAYHAHRNGLLFPQGERSTFFATRRGGKIRLSRLQRAFRRLCNQAAIRRQEADAPAPRIHDLRATFAVHRLVAWYRSGEDLEQRLPYLVTYLGHTSLAGTQRYLRMTPELLAEASRLFAQYAAVGNGGHHV